MEAIETSISRRMDKDVMYIGGAVVKNLPANVGDRGPIPGLGRSPGEGNGNPLQYSRLENPMDRGARVLQSLGSQSQS